MAATSLEQSDRRVVVELIPDECYLVVFDAADQQLLNDDVIEELRVLAYAERDKGVLGPTEWQGVAVGLAEAIATGLVSNVIWDRFHAALRFARNRRERRSRDRIATPEGVQKRAMDAVHAVGIVQSAQPATLDLHLTDSQNGVWRIVVNADRRQIDLTTDSTAGTMHLKITT